MSRSNRFQFSVVWIPRKYDVIADHLSRCLDSDDWAVAMEVFYVVPPPNCIVDCVNKL